MWYVAIHSSVLCRTQHRSRSKRQQLECMQHNLVARHCMNPSERCEPETHESHQRLTHSLRRLGTSSALPSRTGLSASMHAHHAACARVHCLVPTCRLRRSGACQVQRLWLVRTWSSTSPLCLLSTSCSSKLSLAATSSYRTTPISLCSQGLSPKLAEATAALLLPDCIVAAQQVAWPTAKLPLPHAWSWTTCEQGR